MCLIFKFLHGCSIKEFLYSVPMSVMNVLIGPYFRKNSSNIVFATVFEFLFGTGMATTYFERSHINVTAYSFP